VGTIPILTATRVFRGGLGRRGRTLSRPRRCSIRFNRASEGGFDPAPGAGKRRSGVYYPASWDEASQGHTLRRPRPAAALCLRMALVRSGRRARYSYTGGYTTFSRRWLAADHIGGALSAAARVRWV
jgi:hypothetical protein